MAVFPLGSIKMLKGCHMRFCSYCGHELKSSRAIYHIGEDINSGIFDFLKKFSNKNDKSSSKNISEAEKLDAEKNKLMTQLNELTEKMKKAQGTVEAQTLITEYCKISDKKREIESKISSLILKEVQDKVQDRKNKIDRAGKELDTLNKNWIKKNGIAASYRHRRYR